MRMTDFGLDKEEIDAALAALSKEKIVERIWKKDWTVWKNEPKEIANRLGWLTSPQEAWKVLPGIDRFVREVRRDRYTHILLLGMGGSSLTPLVLGSTFKTRPGCLDLAVLDSTVPAAVLEVSLRLNPAKTLFIVSSKSGTTVETVSLFNFFWNRTADYLGEDRTGEHFTAITDEGTPLAEKARRLRFRSLFLGDPDIGGRFSALSSFGLIPGSLKGINLSQILKSAKGMAQRCRETADLWANPGACLGAILGVMAQKGKDKATFFLSPKLAALGAWLEQLIAESTGKEGKGIVPVEGEPPGPPEVYGPDRFFIQIKMRADVPNEDALRRLIRAGFSALSLNVPSAGHLGGQFFLWEFATAVAGHFLDVNPFDQPNVDLTKKKTQGFLETYREKGILPEEKPRVEEDGVSLFSENEASTLTGALKNLLDQARPGDYIAIQAFLSPEAPTTQALQKLRTLLRDKTALAVTVGYGPRFLHSTGQLHKGDSGRGMFIQVTANDTQDLLIPDAPGASRSSLTFGILKAAQARGDYEALKSSGRRIIRFHLSQETGKGLAKIISAVQEN
jgi:glucose-6-phosphate isomerase/transaldolase/glucose-6-phosphate isomerase